jgi:hypothetical protein
MPSDRGHRESPLIGAYVSPDTKAQLQALARARGCTVSAVLREFVVKGLAEAR